MKRQTLMNVLGYLLAFGLLSYVVYSNWKPGDPAGLASLWNKHVVEGEPVHWGFLAIAVCTLTYGLCVTLVRWYLLVRAQDLPFRLADAFRLGLIGFFFNTFLPGSVGGDVIKAAGLAREQSRRTVAVATVIMDRVIALWGLIWFVAGLGVIFWCCGLLENSPGAEAAKHVVQIAVTIVVVSVVIWLLMGLLPTASAEGLANWLGRLPRVGTSAAEFWRAVWMYRLRQKSVFLTLLLSWTGHVGFVLTFYCCVRVLWDPEGGVPIPTLAEHFLIVPVGLVIQAMPLFPGGAGIGEAGFGGLYNWFGCAASTAVLGSLVQRVLNWMGGLVGFLVWLRMRSKLPQTTAEEGTPATVAESPLPVA